MRQALHTRILAARVIARNKQRPDLMDACDLEIEALFGDEPYQVSGTDALCERIRTGATMDQARERYRQFQVSRRSSPPTAGIGATANPSAVAPERRVA